MNIKGFADKVKAFFSNNKWLIIFLLMIPFFNDSYESFKILPDWVMDRCRIVVFVILLTILILKKKMPSLLLCTLFVMEAWWMITTVINYGPSYSEATYKTFIDIINALSVAMIVEAFKEDGKSLINGLILNLELAFYPNFITVIMNHADHGYYLLGYYAVLILWILPAICVGALYIILNKKYIRGTILIIVSIATAIITWCATIIVALLGMVGVIILGVLFMCSNKTKNIKLLLSVFVIVALLGNLFVLFVYSGGGKFPLVDSFIEHFLGRTTTFTGRTPIWEKAFEMIALKPWIGYGYRPSITRADGFIAIHAHNMLIQRLTATGIVGLILFVFFHVALIHKVDRMKNSIARTIMVGAVFAINITYLMDAYKKFFRFYLVFFLAYHIDELIANKTNNTDYLLK